MYPNSSRMPTPLDDEVEERELHMTRSAAALATLLALAPCGAWAVPTGNDLMNYYQTSPTSFYEYVFGIWDGMNFTSRLHGDPSPASCVPKDVTYKQIADSVKKYLTEVPKDRNFPAPELVLLAVTDAFPCPPT
jgi:hypothetical protein